MKVNTRYILKDGFDITLSRSEPWLVAVLNNLFPGDVLDWDSVRGQIHLDNLSDNIALSGRIQFTHHPLCAHCGEPLTRHENIPLTANFVPKTALAGEASPSPEEEVELTADDLDFAFYENDEVEIDPIVNDEIALALPYNYYCEARDICQAQYEKLMLEHTAGDIDPRWAGLKNIKIKGKISS